MLQVIESLLRSNKLALLIYQQANGEEDSRRKRGEGNDAHS